MEANTPDRMSNAHMAHAGRARRGALHHRLVSLRKLKLVP